MKKRYFIEVLMLLCTGTTYALDPNISVVPVDTQGAFHGTFQSHNQKVVSNSYGIFITYLHSLQVNSLGGYTAGVWRLARSTDGGTTFTTLYESVNGTLTPVIESDSNGNLYVGYSDWDEVEGNAYLLIFRASSNFTNPTRITLTEGAAGKYAMILDEPRQQLYYAANAFAGPTNWFYTIGFDGTIRAKFRLTRLGVSAEAHYPLLSLDTNGDLYAAWSSVRPLEMTYWSIHVIRSTDGGTTWETLNRTPLSLPVVADESGPTDQVTLPDELAPSTWLSSFLIKNGKIHFAYHTYPTGNVPDRQHYVRYDIASGIKDIDLYPNWSGGSLMISNLDGFFTTDPVNPNSPLYFISRSSTNRLAVLYSPDNGSTWHDYAMSPISMKFYYAIGGARKITSDGYIIGTYTDVTLVNGSPSVTSPSEVMFFKIQANITTAPPPPPPPSCTQLHLDTTQAVSNGGFAWEVRRSFDAPADTSANPTQSILRIFENNRELGPPHTVYTTIRDSGLGAFSHWQDTTLVSNNESVWFSSLDNSNPKTNGRSYSYCIDTSSPAPSLPLPLPDISTLDGRVFTVTDHLTLNYPAETTGFNWELVRMGSAASAVAQMSGMAPVITSLPTLGLAPLDLQPGRFQVRVQAVRGTDTSAWGSAHIILALENAASVRVYPNPFRTAQAHSGITFDQMPVHSTVKIFTVSAQWVKTLAAPEGIVLWDLTNNSGDHVASGIYFYLITTSGGHKTRGTFAVIR